MSMRQNDLREQMQKIRAEREKAKKDEEIQHPNVSLIMNNIAPIITDFIKGDPLLEIHSTDLHGFYIVYANVKKCRLSISASNRDSINVDMISDSGYVPVYSGILKEKEIKNAVKNALLNWYGTIL